MTFNDWYSANVAPQVEQQLNAVPADARPIIRKASQKAMAACWNAAVDATFEAATHCDSHQELQNLSQVLKVKS